MKLLVFDLDGTLTRTNAVDDECFLQALADAHGMHKVNRRWTEYDHITDLGIFQQAFGTHFRRQPSPSEASKVIECFLGLLRARHAANAALFAEISGAAQLLKELEQNSEWAAAIATGCWEPSARFKMEIAAIDAAHLPAAFADDGPSRESIVQTAITKARKHYRTDSFERVVSIGDATWDVQTARRLGLPFLGIGGARRSERLRQAGASHTVENFIDQQQFLQFIDEAEIPATT
jgi:phosphoglycolate phosphatase-like HAD superfamily hydrolase